MSASPFARAMHRVHRAVGTVLALMVAIWFASGAVMAFAGFPELSDSERLALAPALPVGSDVEIPAALEGDLARVLADGSRVRLAVLEGIPTWVTTNAASERVALRAVGGATVARLTEQRARAEVERRFGLGVVESELLTGPNQWTLTVAKPGVLPLYRLRLDDPAATEAYLSARTGELLQMSTREERVLAWLGAIPHWVYPTILRRERQVWRYFVLLFAVAGLVVTLSGMIAGLHVYRATRKRKAPRDPYLRWHQNLGLGFGLLANTWLFSGALSLVPFDWSGPRGPVAEEQRALYGGFDGPMQCTAGAALRRCQELGDVRELDLALLGGHVLAVCAGLPGDVRVVDMMEKEPEAASQVAPGVLQRVADQLASEGSLAELTFQNAFDAYYYPTHYRPDAVLPFVKIATHDAQRTVYYLDPTRARLLRKSTYLLRVERWLYNGLHSLDVAGLYDHPVLWRSLIVLAMIVGFVLSGLGVIMWLRRTGRRRARRERDARRAAGSASMRA